MAAADPVHHQDGLVAVLVEIDDDLLDQQPHKPLFGSGIGSRRVPDERQIPGQSQQGGGVDLRLCAHLDLGPPKLRFDLGDPFQRGIPTGLKGTRDVSLGGVDMLVAAFGERRPVARLLEFLLNGQADSFLRLGGLFPGQQGSLDGLLGDGFEQLAGDGDVHADPADADAETGTDMPVVAPALVAV
jgi:hypothetical protein